MRLMVLLTSVLFAARAFAAPDETALGKDEGYPLCPRSLRTETRCLVALLSRYDELFPARKVARAATARPLKRAGAEPAIRYTYQSQSGGLDDYLSRNRTTGLLILKGDTILVERYQYGRTDRHRFTSWSMAKTVTGMLVGIAIDEGHIRSVDDLAARYVPELAMTEYGRTSKPGPASPGQSGLAILRPCQRRLPSPSPRSASNTPLPRPPAHHQSP